MKIKAVKISSFGQWQQQAFDFGAGLQILQGLNEAGKTTLHQFIIGMLYGFPSKRKQANIYDFGKSSEYGGTLVFEHQGREYELTRLGRTKTQVKLVLTATQQEMADPEAVLEQILGPIDRNIFTAVFSFDQAELMNIFTLKPADFLAHLRRLALPGSDQWTNLADGLEKEAADEMGLTKTARRLLNRAFRDLQSQVEAVEKLSVGQPELRALMEEKANLEQTIKTLNNEQQNEQVQAQTAAHQEHLRPVLQRLEAVELQLQSLPMPLDQRLLGEYRNLQAQISNLQGEYTNQLPSEADLNRAHEAAAELAINMQEQQLTAQQQASRQSERQRIMEQHGWTEADIVTPVEAPAEQAKQTNLPGIALLFVALLALLGGVFMHQVIAGVIAAVILGGIALWLLLRQRANQQQQQVDASGQQIDREHIQNLDVQIKEYVTKQQALIPRMVALQEQLAWLGEGLSAERYQQKVADIQAQLKVQEQQRQQRNQLQAKLQSCLLELGVRDAVDLKVRQQADQQRENLVREAETLNQQLGDVDRKQLKQAPKQAAPARATAAVAEELSAQQTALAQVNVRLERLATDDQLQTARQRLATLRADVAEQFETMLVKRLASQWIQATLAGAIGEQLPKMMQKTNILLAALTDNHYIEVKFNDNELAVYTATHEKVDVYNLSKGTAEQLYVAMRLAMAEIINATVQMPLLIDDAFVDFDQMRYQAMLQVLQQLAEQGQQILYFTARPLVGAGAVIDLNQIRG